MLRESALVRPGCLVMLQGRRRCNGRRSVVRWARAARVASGVGKAMLLGHVASRTVQFATLTDATVLLAGAHSLLCGMLLVSQALCTLHAVHALGRACAAGGSD